MAEMGFELGKSLDEETLGIAGLGAGAGGRARGASRSSSGWAARGAPL